MRGIGRIAILTSIDWSQMAGVEKNMKVGVFLSRGAKAVIAIGADNPSVCVIRGCDKVTEEGLTRMCKCRVGRWDVEGDKVESSVGSHGKGDVGCISCKMGWGRDALAKACEGCGDEEGDTTRGRARWKVVVEKARVRGTQEENMVVMMGGDGTDVPRANEVFMGVIKVCFLDEEKVRAEAGKKRCKVRWAGDEGVCVEGGHSIVRCVRWERYRVVKV